MMMDIGEIIQLIEGEDFQWAVCKEANGTYTAFVSERKSVYIADALNDSYLTENSSLPQQALWDAFNKERKYREQRKLT